MTGPVADAVWAAYRAAVVVVQTGSCVLRVEPGEPGLTEGVFPCGKRETVHVITAHISHGVTDAVNRDRQTEMEQTLADRGIRWWSAQGGDRDWTHVEDSVAVVGVSEGDAIELGRRFQQDAIFAWTASAWTLVSCRDERRQVMGWRCEQII